VRSVSEAPTSGSDETAMIGVGSPPRRVSRERMRRAASRPSQTGEGLGAVRGQVGVETQSRYQQLAQGANIFAVVDDECAPPWSL
jgi:hypothetical protein